MCTQIGIPLKSKILRELRVLNYVAIKKKVF